MAGVRVEVRHSGEVMLAATDGHRLACVKGQGAIEILRASERAKLLATDDPHGRKVASNTLISLDWIEEYLGLEKAEGGAE